MSEVGNVQIEHVMLARYAEVGADRLLHIVGGGIGQAQRATNAAWTQLYAVAFVSAAVDLTKQHLAVNVRAPDNSVAATFNVHIDMRLPPGVVGQHIPIVCPLPLQLHQVGGWRVEVVTDGDMRAITFNVV